MTTDARRAGVQAKQELEHTEAAFAAVRAAMIDKLLGTPVAASQARESLYLGVQSLDAVRKALFDVVAGGQIAAAIEDVANAAKS